MFFASDGIERQKDSKAAAESGAYTGGMRMMTIAGFAIPRLFDKPRNAPAPRRPFQVETVRLNEASDLGECAATGVHAIYAQVRIYICVSMEPKPDALAAQREADRKQAAGLFEVDAMWRAAAVNARWGRGAVLCDAQGQVLEGAVFGARGMTDAGAREVFFEFHALEHYPDEIYLTDGKTRIRVR